MKTIWIALAVAAGIFAASQSFGMLVQLMFVFLICVHMVMEA